MKKSNEDKIQEEIYTWFNNNYCLTIHTPRLLIHATPNGGYRNEIEAQNMRKTGTTPGIADLTIKGMNSRFVDIEIKTDKGIQSDSQKKIQQRLKDNDCHYLLVRSLLDFQLQIEPLMNFLRGE